MISPGYMRHVTIGSFAIHDKMGVYHCQHRVICMFSAFLECCAKPFFYRSSWTPRNEMRPWEYLWHEFCLMPECDNQCGKYSRTNNFQVGIASRPQQLPVEEGNRVHLAEGTCHQQGSSGWHVWTQMVQSKSFLAIISRLKPLLLIFDAVWGWSNRLRKDPIKRNIFFR